MFSFSFGLFKGEKPQSKGKTQAPKEFIQYTMTIWYRWNMANPRECGVGWPSFVFRESFSSPNFSYMMIRFSWEIALLKGRHILQQGQFEAIQNLQVDKIYCRKYLPT